MGCDDVSDIEHYIYYSGTGQEKCANFEIFDCLKPNNRNMSQNSWGLMHTYLHDRLKKFCQTSTDRMLVRNQTLIDEIFQYLYRVDG